MQITNNVTSVQLNEQKILDLIINPKIEILERVFKEYYQVKTVLELKENEFYTFLYLCIIVSDLKAIELADIYGVTVGQIVDGTKKVFAKTHTDKLFNKKVYALYITFNQKLRQKKLNNVA